jgi:uncharacterized protein (TIGR02246 family)
MKKIHFLIFLFAAVIISCNNSTTESGVAAEPHNDHANALIADTIRILFNGVIKAAEDVNSEALLKYFSSSADLRVINQDGQVIAGLDSLRVIVHSYYGPLAYQKIRPSEPFIKVLSPDIAVVTYASEFTAYTKDSSTLGGPVGWTFLCVKESGQWKILNMHQSIKWRDVQSASMKKGN